jgi:hypothetical protein
MERPRWFTLLLVAVVLAAAGWQLGGRDPSQRDAGTGRSLPQTAVPQPGGRYDPAHPLTSSLNWACTPGQGTAALLHDLGPFCLPPDTIRSVDHPRFLDASRVRFLSPREPVVALAVNGVAKAYPVRILVWHEIVNDRIGGRPVAVTYCPLCNTAIVFDRRVQGRTLMFGVSGRLAYGNLILFDRETETLWQQITGRATRGRYVGRRLKIVPSVVQSFGDFRASWPDGLVMTERTGQGRSQYGTDPYAGYGLHPKIPSLFQFGTPADPRLPPRARVFGVQIGRSTATLVLPRGPGPRSVSTLRLGGTSIVVLWQYGTGQPGTTSSFARLSAGWEGAAFRGSVRGQRLQMMPTARGFVDRSTGTVFDESGLAISGPLQGRRLTPVLSTTGYWFAWSFFHPKTSLVRVR